MSAIELSGGRADVRFVTTSEHAIRRKDDLHKQPEAPLRLLLVEDDLADALIFMRLLRGVLETPAMVERAQTCSEAISMLRDMHFDVVVMDLNLPDAENLETISKLRPYAPDSALIALTGVDEQQTILAAALLGVQSFLCKANLTHPQLEQVLCYALQRKKERDRLIYLAFNDPLTGLANRRLFSDRLSQALDRGRRSENPTAVVYMDIDRFKSINDSLGHEAGDFLLVKIAERLKVGLRTCDLAARMGGDEFTAIIEDISPKHLEALVDRLLVLFRAPIEMGDTNMQVTISAGAAMSMPLSTPKSLLAEADRALYKSKQAGRDRFTITQESVKKTP